MVASLPSGLRGTCAPASIVLLADSVIGLGQLAVIATPSRARRARSATGSIASIPWAAFSIVRSFLVYSVVDYYGRRARSGTPSPADSY
jgi:hypothetical protein